MKANLLFAAAALLQCWGASAQDVGEDQQRQADVEATQRTSAGGASWIGNKPGGFFFYEDPAPAQATPVTPPFSTPAPPPLAAMQLVPAPAPPTDAVPSTISTAWIRKHLQDYMDRAIDDPTPEHVQAYLALQQIAMVKSTQFAQVTNAQTIGNPLFDFNFVRPTSNMGSHALDEQADANRRKVLQKMSKTVGIWYFFRSDCPYCAKQGPVLNEFTKRYGVSILPISLDGGPPPSGEFGHYVTDQGQAAAISPQVEATPSLYLAKPATGEYAAVSQGMLALDELLERVITAAHSANLISDDEYAACQPEKEPEFEPQQQRLREVVAATPVPEHHDAPALYPGQLETTNPLNQLGSEIDTASHQ